MLCLVVKPPENSKVGSVHVTTVSPSRLMGVDSLGPSSSRSKPDNIYSKPSFNPFKQLIESTGGESRRISFAYAEHRRKRNAAQRAKLLEDGAESIVLDNILEKLERGVPGFVDPRNNISVLARPPLHIHALIDRIQAKLLATAPHLWVSPSHLRHITLLEVAHTKTPLQIKEHMDRLRTYLEDLLKYPCSHMVRLHRPLLSYDGAGVALTFLPADSDSGFPEASSQLDKAAICSADYSYHHLRQDMFNLCSETGITPESRYHNPSAHVTIARFITSVDFSAETSANGDTESLLAVHGPERMKKWIDTIEEINRWLMEEYWPDPSNDLLPNPPPSETDAAGQWIIGKDAILDCRTGNNWYGGGDPGLPELDSLCGRIWGKPMREEALVQATVAVKIESRPLPMRQ